MSDPTQDAIDAKVDAAVGSTIEPTRVAMTALAGDVRELVQSAAQQAYAEQLAAAAQREQAANDATAQLQTRYEALQAKYDALVASTPPQPPPPPPATDRLIVGAAFGGGSLAPLEARLGAKLEGHRIYGGKEGQAASLTPWYADIEADLKAGREPWATFKTPAPADVTAGKYASWVAPIGPTLRALAEKYGKTIYVDPDHEPENMCTPAEYQAMLRYLSPLLRSRLVQLGGCAQVYHSVPAKVGTTVLNPGGTSKFLLADCVPGGGVIDYWLTDGYESYMDKNQKPTWRNWSGIFGYIQAELAKKGVTQWGLGEFGVTLAAYQADKTIFTKITTALTKAGGSVALYFDSDGGGSTSHWRMDNGDSKTLGTPDAREAEFATILKES